MTDHATPSQCAALMSFAKMLHDALPGELRDLRRDAEEFAKSPAIKPSKRRIWAALAVTIAEAAK